MVLHEQEAKHQLQKLHEEICNVRNELEWQEEIEAENEENDEEDDWNEDYDEEFDEEHEEWFSEEMQENPENLYQQNPFPQQNISAINASIQSRSSSPGLFPLLMILAIFCMNVTAECNKTEHYYIESVKIHHQWMKFTTKCCNSYNECVTSHHHWKNIHPIMMADENSRKLGGATLLCVSVAVPSISVRPPGIETHTSMVARGMQNEGASSLVLSTASAIAGWKQLVSFKHFWACTCGTMTIGIHCQITSRADTV